MAVIRLDGAQSTNGITVNDGDQVIIGSFFSSQTPFMISGNAGVTTAFTVEFSEPVYFPSFDTTIVTAGQATVDVVAGRDLIDYTFQSVGGSFTMNVGDGATIGTIDLSGMNDPDPSNFVVLDIGTNVAMNGYIQGGAPDVIYEIGQNFSAPDPDSYIAGSTESTTWIATAENLNLGGSFIATGTGEATLRLGNDMTVGGIDMSGTGDRLLLTGNDLTVSGTTGSVDVGSTGARVIVNFGARVTIQNDITLGTNVSTNNAFFFADVDLSVGGDFTSGNGNDEVIFGDNWRVGGAILAGDGDDTFTLGAPRDDNPTNLFGEGGFDRITIAAPTDPAARETFFTNASAAGWAVNRTTGQIGSSSTAVDFTTNGLSIAGWEGSASPICFAAGTQIEVADGDTVAVEDLRQGDMVMTADHGLQPVRWIGATTLTAPADNMRPIRIAAGALGGGMPVRDLLVSPQHRMLVRSTIAQKMFGEDEILVAAKHLVLIDGIDVAHDVTEVTYVHFLCDQHEVVFANGAASESLYTGPQALKSVSPAAVAEIMALFPELADVDYKALSARKMVNGRMGRQLAVRHKNKQSPLLATRH